jgi:hypothetical protein
MSWLALMDLHAAFELFTEDQIFGGKQVMLKTNLVMLITTALLAANAAAQMPDVAPVTMAAPMFAAVQPKAGVSVSIDGMDITPVKGAPFCAVITTEHTQPFADGNRIHTTDSSTLCRDSEGRTRREAGLNLLGAAAQNAAESPQSVALKTKLITIVDPVAGFRYMLDSNTKTARKMALPPPPNVAGAKSLRRAGAAIKEDRVMVYREGGEPGADVVFGNVFINNEEGPNGQAPATENLGDQTLDGIHATGTRVSTTIPAGKMGNEQPIVVTSERWYSPELKATIMTKHNDPWAGELKTQFTNVNTSEPDTSLFVVPSDYKVVEEKGGPFTIKLPPPAPPAE